VNKEIKDIENANKVVDEEVDLFDCVNHIVIKPNVTVNVTISGLETGMAPTVR